MTSGEFRPKSTSIDPELATPANIYGQLREIAFLNEDFREGQAGSFTLALGQDGRNRIPSEPPTDDEWPAEYETSEYNFDANRFADDDGSTTLNFSYSLTRVKHNILLPPHIAAYAFGGKSNPVLAAGPSRKIHTIEAEIDNTDFQLAVCETVEYLDKEDEKVAEVTSLPYPEESLDVGQTVFPHTPFEKTATFAPGEVLDLESLTDPNVPLYFRNDAARRYQTYGEAPTLDDLEAIIDDYDPVQQELIFAYHVLQSMKDAFRRRLSLPI